MKTILLLEDDESLNRGISLKLSKEGYRVLSACTVREANAIFEKEAVDLVISDITLPDGNGLDFGRTVREKSNVHLIYLTAMDQVWGNDGQFVDDNTVTVNISRLKNKLETECIANVRGLGYLWTGKVNKR